MTPLELSVADGFISVGLVGGTAGLACLIFVVLPRKWREAGERADRLADPAPLPGEIGDDTLRMLREPTAEDTERAIDALLKDLDQGDRP